MIDKVGVKPYLGIEIDYDRDKKLDRFSISTLEDRYLWEKRNKAGVLEVKETSPQEAFARAAVFVSTYKDHTDFEMAQRIYDYASNLWFMFATPILSNGGTTRGLPISCFLNSVPDSLLGLADHYKENIFLSSSGGGIGGYWGGIRSDGTATSRGSKSSGSIPFMHVVDSLMLGFTQGQTRRGSYAAYMDVWHPEIEEFVAMRKESGGDLNRKNLNLHNGVNLNNEFLQAVEEDADWRLIDPKTKEAVKTIKARELWSKLLDARAETGEPYLINIDTCNEALPQSQKDLGLEIKQSNLCSEITLATNDERTAVCCLSSVNLEHYDKWKENEFFIPDLVTMLDNVLEHFIEDIVDTSMLGEYNANYKRFQSYVKAEKEPFTKAAYSAYRERSIGLGAMGFHSYLQSKNLPFAGLIQTSLNREMFEHIKSEAVKTSEDLARNRGNCPDSPNLLRRNCHLLAVAPNASSSIICGGTSPSIEPIRANVFTHKTLSGNFKVRNKYLDKAIKKKDLKKEEVEKVWDKILDSRGSIQEIDIFTDEEKEVFKTADEINQIQIIEHAHQRQEFICQSQSVNLFFVPPKATAPQEEHDKYLQYVNDVHWYGMHKLKSLYYFRSDTAKAAENVNVKIQRIKLDEVTCVACEG